MKRAAMKLIRFYQREISPMKGRPTCRFVPTCSEYARVAIERFGVLKGSRLAAKRLVRCGPWSKGGYDPVPEDPCTTLRRE